MSKKGIPRKYGRRVADIEEFLHSGEQAWKVPMDALEQPKTVFATYYIALKRMGCDTVFVRMIDKELYLIRKEGEYEYHAEPEPVPVTMMLQKKRGNRVRQIEDFLRSGDSIWRIVMESNAENIAASFHNAIKKNFPGECEVIRRRNTIYLVRSE